MNEPTSAGFLVEDDTRYAVHDGVELTGTLYRPAATRPTPALVAVHGGAWKAGGPAQYQYWGPWLARRGIAVFAIRYRLVQGERNRYPAAVHDVRAAVRFVRAHASTLGIDPDRIGLVGASAGAHLSALVGLAGDLPRFAPTEPRGSEPSVSASVKVVVGVCGIYDMVAQWQHDQLARPRDQQTAIFLGVDPMESRMRYHEASPLTYATVHASTTSFLLSWGTDDDVVDWRTQSRTFLAALKQAGYYVRIVPVHGAPHFWMYDPIDEPQGHAGYLAPKLLRFLNERL